MTMNVNGYKVQNVPEYAMTKSYIVVRLVGDELWFWGAWNDETAANDAAADIGGAILYRG